MNSLFKVIQGLYTSSFGILSILSYLFYYLPFIIRFKLKKVNIIYNLLKKNSKPNGREVTPEHIYIHEKNSNKYCKVKKLYIKIIIK